MLAEIYIEAILVDEELLINAQFHHIEITDYQK
jgi:hypothetical protein